MPDKPVPPDDQPLREQIPAEWKDFQSRIATPKGFASPKPLTAEVVRERASKLKIQPTVPMARLLASLNRVRLDSPQPVARMPEDVRASVQALKPPVRRVHGSKFSLLWFPFPSVVSPCADRFGYMSSATVRAASALPFNTTMQALMGQLGNLMADTSRDPNPNSNSSSQAGVSNIPAGYTYFGQFVDHDVTLDVSSTLSVATDANTLNNMRTPALDLDSLYGRGPALDPFLYVFPQGPLPATAIKFQLGTNTPTGPGGPGGAGGAGGMQVKTNWDVPRVPGTLTAVIGDPRNDENLIVGQFHHAMLRFHNAVVDQLTLVEFEGDIFAEAKRMVTHHYQWAVVNDFLKRVCGATAVSNALATVVAPVGSAFRMPVEFAVAAYRFGHSMIRNSYWLNFGLIDKPLADVFAFARPPQLPVFSNWVVDFNAFFDTGVSVPVNNKARKIDSFLAKGLEELPGFTGLMAILATRNLRRGLALGLPSGQAMASSLGVPALTSAQLTSGLQADEVAVLNSNGGLLLSKTPLWYYVLREAAVLEGGNQLGPLGARIVAETFVRMLKRDANSYLNAAGGFAPTLGTNNDFTVGDLVTVAGVTTP